MLPNGSRLSCGASAGERKRPTLRDQLAGGQTHGSLESRPRQLQVLVRPHTNQLQPSMYSTAGRRPALYMVTFSPSVSKMIRNVLSEGSCGT